MPFIHNTAFDALAAASIRTLTDATPIDFVRTAWSVAVFSVLHSPLLNAISAASLRTIRSFPPESISNMAWSVSRLEFPTEPLREAISASALPNCEHLEFADVLALASTSHSGRQVAGD